MNKSIRWVQLTFVALIVQLASSTVQAAYAMKIQQTFPKGSAGEKLAAKYPTGTKLSPCDGIAFDALAFTATYDASNTTTKKVDRDVYLFLHNPEAKGAPRFMVMHKQGLGSSLLLLGRNSLDEISPTSDIYLPRDENLGPITENLISSSISAQSAVAGIWQMVGIVADGTKPSFTFDDPSTWDAWDVATVMLRKPWVGSVKTICE